MVGEAFLMLYSMTVNLFRLCKARLIVELIFILLLLAFNSCTTEPKLPTIGTLQLNKVRVGSFTLNLTSSNLGAPIDKPIVLEFSAEVNTDLIGSKIQLVEIASSTVQPVSISFLDNNKTVSLQPSITLTSNTEYKIKVYPTLKGKANENFIGVEIAFKTKVGELSLTSLSIGGVIAAQQRVTNVPLSLSIELQFNKPLKP